MELFGKYNIKIPSFFEKKEKKIVKSLGIGAGKSKPQSSESTVETFKINADIEEVKTDFAIEFLIGMENLAAYNSDFSYALDNIVQLGNKPHTISFDKGVSEEQAAAMLSHLKDKEKNWYEYSEGTSSLKGDLLAQIVVNGALSAEIVPAVAGSKFVGVDKIVKLSPKYVRFALDKETNNFKPYQKLNGIKNGNQFIELNTNTYHYIALRRLFDSPYATPPFITALEDLMTQKEMKSSFSNIMKMFGMLGLASVLVEPPQQEAGESDDEFNKRAMNYLNSEVLPQLINSLSSGVVAGFKDSHEFKLEGNNMNVQGAEGLMKIIQLSIFSGLKQDPNMLGHNFSTTETFGKVILTKLKSQVKEYQNILDRFFEEMYKMELLFAGFNFKTVNVESEPPIASDKKIDAETEKITIDNVSRKYNEGVIDQQQKAKELGYEKPAEKEPLKITLIDKIDNPTEEEKKTKEEQNSIYKLAIEEIEKSLKSGVKEFEYHTIDCNGVTSLDKHKFADFEDDKMEEFVSTYFNKSNKKYQKAIDRAVTDIYKELKGMPTGSTLERIYASTYYQLVKAISGDYLNEQKKVTKLQVQKIYDYYRKDKSIFGVKEKQYVDGFVPPDVSFGLLDFRAIEFAEGMDTMYLGKFITDADTKKKFYSYLEDKYIKNNLPIGNNDAAINEFKAELKELLYLENWKIRRVIDTSVSRIRNNANLLYIDQAQLKTFEISEIVDNLTCPYCEQLDGKEFKVSKAVSNIEKMVNGNYEDIAETSPFVTTIPYDKFENMNEADLQDKDINTPPFHPHCRGRIISS